MYDNGKRVQTVFHIVNGVNLFNRNVIYNGNEEASSLAVWSVLPNYIKIGEVKFDIDFKPDFAERKNIKLSRLPYK